MLKKNLGSHFLEAHYMFPLQARPTSLVEETMQSKISALVANQGEEQQL